MNKLKKKMIVKARRRYKRIGNVIDMDGKKLRAILLSPVKLIPIYSTFKGNSGCMVPSIYYPDFVWPVALPQGTLGFYPRLSHTETYFYFPT